MNFRRLDQSSRLFYLPKIRKEGANMEQIEQVQGIETFENDIAMYLRIFCEEQQIEDMRAASQSVYNACLRYIQRHVFRDKDILRDKSNIYNINNNIMSNYNRYNYDLLNDICDYYIYMSMLYDKEVSIMGFSNLTGIDNDTVTTWNKADRLSSSSMRIYKKLCENREESLSNKLVTGNKHPLGVIAVLNRQFGWASPYTSDSNRQQQPLTAAQLPRLDIQPQDIAQIEAKPQDIVVDSVKTECT